MALRPLDIEYKVGSKKELLSETDIRGVITYANENFVALSGYSESELVGSPHSILRHIDMPRTVFKLLWNALNAGQPYKAIVQNKRRDGKYYWVYSEYQPLFDKSKNIRGFRSKRYAVPKKAVSNIQHLYKELLSIETEKSQQDAEYFLEAKLHDHGFEDYAAYVEDLKNKQLKGMIGVFGKLFR